jgi:hypothetical protein
MPKDRNKTYSDRQSEASRAKKQQDQQKKTQNAAKDKPKEK